MLLSLQEGLWRSAYFWQMRLASNLRQEEILEYHKVDSPKNTQCWRQKMWMQGVNHLTTVWMDTLLSYYEGVACVMSTGAFKVDVSYRKLARLLQCDDCLYFSGNLQVYWRCQCVSFLCAMGITVYLFAHDVNILDIQHQQKTRSNLANLSLSLICGSISMWMWKLQSFGWDQLCGELA
jgi:hypothetical protein